MLLMTELLMMTNTDKLESIQDTTKSTDILNLVKQTTTGGTDEKRKSAKQATIDESDEKRKTI